MPDARLEEVERLGYVIHSQVGQRTDTSHDFIYRGGKQARDVPRGDGFQVLGDQIDMPVLEKRRGWFQHRPRLLDVRTKRARSVTDEQRVLDRDLFDQEFSCAVRRRDRHRGKSAPSPRNPHLPLYIGAGARPRRSKSSPLGDRAGWLLRQTWLGQGTGSPG
jgi:hypothetical protein